MKILLIYATYSSGTLLTSRLIIEELKNNGHDVTLVNAADVDPGSFVEYELIMMGSPSWLVNKKEGQPHHLYFELMKKLEGKELQQKKFAVFALGDSSYAHICGAADHLVEWVTQLKGNLIIEPLRVDSFFFERDKNEALIKEWATNLHNKI